MESNLGKIGRPQYYTNAELKNIGGQTVDALSAQSMANFAFHMRIANSAFRGLIGETDRKGHRVGRRSVILRHIISENTGTPFKFFRDEDYDLYKFTTNPAQDPLLLAEELTRSCDVVQAGVYAKSFKTSLEFLRKIEEDPNAPEVFKIRSAAFEWVKRITDRAFARAFTHKGAFPRATDLVGADTSYDIAVNGAMPATCRGFTCAANGGNNYAYNAGQNLAQVVAGGTPVSLGYAHITNLASMIESPSAPWDMVGVDYVNYYTDLTEEEGQFILLVSDAVAAKLANDAEWRTHVDMSQAAMMLAGKVNPLLYRNYLGRVGGIDVCRCRMLNYCSFEDTGGNNIGWSLLVGNGAMGWATGEHFYDEKPVRLRPIVENVMQFFNGCRKLVFVPGANEALNMPAAERNLAVEQGIIHVFSKI